MTLYHCCHCWTAWGWEASEGLNGPGTSCLHCLGSAVRCTRNKPCLFCLKKTGLPGSNCTGMAACHFTLPFRFLSESETALRQDWPWLFTYSPYTLDPPVVKTKCGRCPGLLGALCFGCLSIHILTKHLRVVMIWRGSQKLWSKTQHFTAERGKNIRFSYCG